MSVLKARPRSRVSAKKAGANHERVVADYLARHVDDRIDRRVTTGAKDKGDIAGLRVGDWRVVVECKNTATVSIGPHLNEAEAERVNDGALAGLVVYKRHGLSGPGKAVVVMTLQDLVALLNGERPYDS